jgi:hypothetical protein
MLLKPVKMRHSGAVGGWVKVNCGFVAVQAQLQWLIRQRNASSFEKAEKWKFNSIGKCPIGGTEKNARLAATPILGTCARLFSKRV